MLGPEQQEKIMGNILKKGGNAFCADCFAKSPCWASLDFGVFICMNCAGAHRSLGPSITRVKSTKLDAWNKDWLTFMQFGNEMINQFFEHDKASTLNCKPNMNSSPGEIRKYVRDKYIKRNFCKPNEDDPITRLKNGEHVAQTSPPKQDKPKPPVEKAKVVVDKPKVKVVKVEKPEIHLLDESIHVEQVKEPAKEEFNLIEDEPLYNTDHFNSFSGVGAKSSHIDFDSLWAKHHGEKKEEENFAQFKKITTPSTPTVPTNHYHYPHSMHSHPHTPHSNPLPSHQFPPYQNVTMNISMNMYPNVMNVNVSGNSNNSSYGQHQQPHSFNLSQPITLETKQHSQTIPKPSPQEKKSWVDDWK